jgi:hypothetical protein
MDTSIITHPTVKLAIEALQAGNSNAWIALFAEDPVLTDDGHAIDFIKYSQSAVGQEHFTTIDKVENDGTAIYGVFRADQWGDFQAFFKFKVNEAGKITQLDIGQASY